MRSSPQDPFSPLLCQPPLPTLKIYGIYFLKSKSILLFYYSLFSSIFYYHQSSTSILQVCIVVACKRRIVESNYIVYSHIINRGLKFNQVIFINQNYFYVCNIQYIILSYTGDKNLFFKS